MMYRVTYYNTTLLRTCTLIDKIDKKTAEAVVIKFGDPKLPYNYMGPEVKAEPDAEDAS